MSALLEVKGLEAAYGSLTALHGIDLMVNPGEIVTLIGSNGAGKSTTLRALSGLLRTRAGTIHFNASPIHHLPAHQIAARGLVHVPEGRRIFPRMTVEENLDVGAYLETDPKRVNKRKDRVFTLFPRLAERRRQEGGTLSGGEQQMLAIGRALMREPTLLMLDEPTLGLAPVIVDQIFDILRDLHRAGLSILLVEQNAWHALQLADRAYVLRVGQIALSGPACELATHPDIQKSYLGG